MKAARVIVLEDDPHFGASVARMLGRFGLLPVRAGGLERAARSMWEHTLAAAEIARALRYFGNETRTAEEALSRARVVAERLALDREAVETLLGLEVTEPA